MPDEGFLRRWSRLKAEGPEAGQPAAAPAPAEVRLPEAAPAVAAQAPHLAVEPAPVLPTLDDVARLDANSDFSAFVSKGVDKDVRRLAMKKLFSDPHFNLVDRLDVYMDDFNKPSPMSAAMLAALHHTKNLFAPLAADKEAEGAAGDAGQTAGVPAGQAPGEGEPDNAANPDQDAAVAIEADGDAMTAQTEPMQFYVAAPDGVLPQPQHIQQIQQGQA